MTAKTSGDSTQGVSGIIFRAIQDSFTTQGFNPKRPPDPSVPSSLRREAPALAGPKPYAAGNVKLVPREASRCPMHCLVTTPS